LFRLITKIMKFGWLQTITFAKTPKPSNNTINMKTTNTKQQPNLQHSDLYKFGPKIPQKLPKSCYKNWKGCKKLKFSLPVG